VVDGRGDQHDLGIARERLQPADRFPHPIVGVG
jgi:hypothetical protein